MGSLQVQTKASHASTLGEPLSAHGICYIVGYIDPRANIINPKLNSFPKPEIGNSMGTGRWVPTSA